MPEENDLIICKGSESGLEEVPSVVKLLPLGHVTSRKGEFHVDTESLQQIKSQFENHGVDLVIDYEHQTLKDIQAPAAGWIKELFLEGDAIAGRVEWTPTATQYLKNKEYRFLSPVILTRKDGKVVGLNSVALTNTPAIDGMYSIVNSNTFQSEGRNEGGKEMDLLKKIAELLGLPEEAAEDQIMEELTARLNEAKALKNEAGSKAGTEEGTVVANKTVCSLLGLTDGAKTEDVAAKIMELKAGGGSEKTLEEKVLKLENQLAQREADDAVEIALKAGKISAAQKDWAKEYALKDRSGFEKFVDKAPQVVPMGELDLESRSLKEKAPDDATLLVCKQLGISEDDLKKYGKGNQ